MGRRSPRQQNWGGRRVPRHCREAADHGLSLDLGRLPARLQHCIGIQRRAAALRQRLGTRPPESHVRRPHVVGHTLGDLHVPNLSLAAEFHALRGSPHARRRGAPRCCAAAETFAGCRRPGRIRLRSGLLLASHAVGNRPHIAHGVRDICVGLGLPVLRPLVRMRRGDRRGQARRQRGRRLRARRRWRGLVARRGAQVAQ
mmetsp:Transcript_5078/g.14986  ORF Transcript_5078/g.14986 Transcript_5078/m.14986 type:complete len:200 (+) Transcript_5078:1186-1785(+)